MPNYSFHCPQCGNYFDRILPFDADQTQVTCPQGHSPLERIYTPAPVVFKGSGYYVTDSREKTKQNGKSS